MTRTHIVLATFAIFLMTPFAHAERYNVRGPDGRFVKQASTAFTVQHPASTALEIHSAAKSESADAELHSHETASTPAQKATLGGWLRNNFTIRSGQTTSTWLTRLLQALI